MPALEVKLLAHPYIANPLVPLIAWPLKIPIAIIKGIIVLILTIVGKIMHICMPMGPLTLPSCPEAMGSFANLYTAFQFMEKNEIFLSQLEAFPALYHKIKARFRNTLKLGKFLVTPLEIVKYGICA